MAVVSNATDIHLRSSAAMALGARTPYSISCWLKATWNPGGRRSFVGIYGPVSDTPLGPPVTALQIGTSVGNYDLTCWTWGGGVIVGTATGTMTGYNDVWTHFVFTFDGSTNRVYRDSVELASSGTVNTDGYLNQVYINGYPGGGLNEVTTFQIDQYALYRRALTPDEVVTIYNTGGAAHGIFNDAICRYEFDEGAEGATATSVVDLTGGQHILTPTGTGTQMTYTYLNTTTSSNIRPVQ